MRCGRDRQWRVACRFTLFIRAWIRESMKFRHIGVSVSRGVRGLAHGKMNSLDGRFWVISIRRPGCKNASPKYAQQKRRESCKECSSSFNLSQATFIPHVRLSSLWQSFISVSSDECCTLWPNILVKTKWMYWSPSVPTCFAFLRRVVDDRDIHIGVLMITTC